MIELLRSLVFRDLWLKLFSFALAFLIWFTVNIAVKNDLSPAATLTLSPPMQELISDLPVVILSSAEDVRSVRVNPKTVDVTVQGDSKILKNLQKKDIRVMVDLTNIEAAHDLRKRVEVSMPPGVAQVHVDPQEVQVIFSPRG
jgi:YbbR domain-containing protein